MNRVQNSAGCPVGLIRLITCLAIALLLISCATEKQVRPGVEHPMNWQAGEGQAGGIVDKWWTGFGDTNLVLLIDEAIQENPDLKAMNARVGAVVEQSRIAGAALLPTVDLQGGASRQQQVFVGLPIPGAAGPLKTRSTSYNLSLISSWELDLWGRIRAGKQAALADYLAATDELRGARLSLVAQTVRAWFQLAEANRQLGLAEATVNSFNSSAARVRERYDEGLRSSLDLRLALNAEANAGALRALRKSEHQTAQRQLESLLGRYPAGSFDRAQMLPALAESVPAGIPSEMLDRRPDLQAAEWRLNAARLRVDEAKAALFPRISLTASGGRTSNELDDLLSHDFGVWSIGANFVQPLFNGGRLRSNVRLNRARVTEAVENYRSTLLKAFREVETALANEALLHSREQELNEAAKQARAAEKLAVDRYESGLESFLAVLESQRRSLDADSLVISVRRQRLDNRVALHLALGGGFSWDATGVEEGKAKTK